MDPSNAELESHIVTTGNPFRGTAEGSLRRLTVLIQSFEQSLIQQIFPNNKD
ncbi:MAG: hypothetical protein Tsb002_33960 [Wenzhouxiangellaceae bacterium]